jgi:Spy/CpxP family protein refolding chaperone
VPRATTIVTSGVGGIRWWRKPDIQQLLNLTQAQVDRLDTVFERERPERIALRRKIAEMDRLLRRILLRANAEDATVKRMSEQVEALRAQHNVRRTLMRFALYRRLTAEQRSALKELRRTDNEMRSGPPRDSDR